TSEGHVGPPALEHPPRDPMGEVQRERGQGSLGVRFGKFTARVGESTAVVLFFLCFRCGFGGGNGGSGINGKPLNSFGRPMVVEHRSNNKSLCWQTPSNGTLKHVMFRLHWQTSLHTTHISRPR